MAYRLSALLNEDRPESEKSWAHWTHLQHSAFRRADSEFRRDSSSPSGGLAKRCCPRVTASDRARVAPARVRRCSTAPTEGSAHARLRWGEAEEYVAMNRSGL